MASDSDLFQKRVFWGFGKTYSLACDGADAPALTPSIQRAVKNMLKGEYRCPALGPLIKCVASFVDHCGGGLFPPQPSAEAELRARLSSVERQFADYGSTHLARQAVEAVAIDLARGAGGDVEQVCCERVGHVLIERFCTAPTACNLRKARQFSQAQLVQYNEAVFAAANEQVTRILREVAHSPAGIPKRIKKETALSVNTAQGLEQPLGVSP